MTKENGIVKADDRKGKVQIIKEDQLIHFQWVLRGDNKVEDDFILFPDEAKFKRVEKVTNSKVFYLDFGTRQNFYWLQEFKNDQEAEEIVNKVNVHLNNQQTSNQCKFFKEIKQSQHDEFLSKSTKQSTKDNSRSKCWSRTSSKYFTKYSKDTNKSTTRKPK